MTTSAESSAGIFDELTAALGEKGVLTGDAIAERYCTDWTGDYSRRPLAVLRPADTEGVATAVRLCARAGLAIIPQGGHTGLVGGGTADGPDQVVLSLDRMNRIRAVDPIGMSMTVEAGCILESVKAAAEEQDCFFPLSLGAQGSCQIGGNISTNAGGLNVLRYGMMRDLLLGIEVVLHDGSVFSDLRALRKNNTGPDLKQIFVGSEGTLGIVTRHAQAVRPAALDRDALAVDGQHRGDDGGLWTLPQGRRRVPVGVRADPTKLRRSRARAVARNAVARSRAASDPWAGRNLRQRRAGPGAVARGDGRGAVR